MSVSLEAVEEAFGMWSGRRRILMSDDEARQRKIVQVRQSLG